MVKVAFKTIGCKTNSHDTGTMIKACIEAGFDIAKYHESADAYVVNTCAVTSSAEAEARNLIRRLIKTNPKAFVVVCGCSSEVFPEQYRSINGVDCVVGVRSERALISCLKKKFFQDKKGIKSKLHGKEIQFMAQDRARAYLKIQDGCNSACSYCIITKARGSSISFPQKVILNELDSIVESGCREVVLTGIHIGKYGEDLGKKNSLTSLVSVILKRQNNIRIRLSSLNPDEINQEIIELFMYPLVCKHLHISLQSGSCDMLRVMGRGSNLELYLKNLNIIKQKIPSLALGADIIVGHPGENETLFNQTVDVIKTVPFSYLHVFPYSKRPGTKSANMPKQVNDRIKKERVNYLREISKDKLYDFYKSQIGKKLDVIIVSKKADENGFIKGVSDNYLNLRLKNTGVQYREIYSCVAGDVVNKEGHIAMDARYLMKGIL